MGSNSLRAIHCHSGTKHVLFHSCNICLQIVNGFVLKPVEFTLHLLSANQREGKYILATSHLSITISLELCHVKLMS